MRGVSDSRHLLFLFAGLLIPVFLMALDVTLAEIYQYNPEGSLHNKYYLGPYYGVFL